MYATGYQYGIEGLKHLARQRFESTIKSKWEPETFPGLISFVYGSCGPTGSPLQEKTCDIAVRNLASLIEQDDFRKVLQTVPQFHLVFTELLMRERIRTVTSISESKRKANLKLESTL